MFSVPLWFAVLCCSFTSCLKGGGMGWVNVATSVFSAHVVASGHHCAPRFLAEAVAAAVGVVTKTENEQQANRKNDAYNCELPIAAHLYLPPPSLSSLRPCTVGMPE